jgi:hypothetical protein
LLSLIDLIFLHIVVVVLVGWVGERKTDGSKEEALHLFAPRGESDDVMSVPGDASRRGLTTRMSNENGG